MIDSSLYASVYLQDHYQVYVRDSVSLIYNTTTRSILILYDHARQSMAVTFILKYLKDFSGNIGNGWMRLNFTYDDILEAVKSFSQRFMIAMEELPDRAKDIRTSVKQSIIDYMRKDSTDDNEESEETEASHDEQLDSPKADVYLPPKKRRNRD
jgi:hypothetical protein